MFRTIVNRKNPTDEIHKALQARRRRTAEAGFDLHLVKPVDYEKLEEALRT